MFFSSPFHLNHMTSLLIRIILKRRVSCDLTQFIWKCNISCVMSWLYYVSICSFFFYIFTPFCTLTKSTQSLHVDFLTGSTTTLGLCPALNRTSEHMSEQDCLCVLVYRKNVWLLYRLLKTQLNQMSWDCFKLDPWAVCGGCVCASVSPALYHCTVPQWCMMLWKPYVSAKPFKQDTVCHFGEQLRHYTIKRRWVTSFLSICCFAVESVDGSIGVHLAT